VIEADRQPFCRCCGKKLKRLIRQHVFGMPEGASPSVEGHWFATPHSESCATRAEAQRFINHQIVNSKKDYAGRLVVGVWDGESYQSEEKFFCTLRCAASYGRFAVTHAPDLRTQNYADAINGAVSR
jgi:hypothetical protein